jgi:DNA mismatch repair ATPase MutS
MVEVGYKYKFFGDDAKVNSFILEFTASSDVGCLDRSQRIRYGCFQ